ncbi:uncharacterized protein PITG_08329 [Phytophthora infestans T30-4]|uniref:Uncharacterized protein n=1 Tax=Phytophthora infestans (strain T30-4) TaxID=403677 RepID=D0NAC2_PHYIT|nr:uncharacterized protein PITG_08329 [Phytophthora infestans T30-4]EEY54780.1 conserved hypothetical protein [Phytophthora infestans T30-4]|eukprot:XP_002903725.1 conserved hypothetical protein [Phytophthora infestans T30-4]
MSPPSASDEFSHEVAAGFLFSEEMKTVRQLQAKCDEGRQLISIIYCSRSCARAFPSGVAANDAEPKKMKQYYHALFSVLQPQVEKIKQLNEYCSQAVVLLSDNIQRTTVHENMTRVIPDVMMDALVDIMDVILQLSHLHDTKSSLRNDFSVFKRTFLHIKDDLPDSELVEKDIVRLQEFMGSSYQAKGSVWDSLRHNLTNVKRYDQVTYLLLRHCVSHIENDVCMTPSSKFKYVRVLSYLMAVLEGSDAWKKTNALPGTDKKVIEAAVKLISRYPVIPMLLEISIKPVKAPHAQSGYKLESVNDRGSGIYTRAMREVLASDFKKKRKERKFSHLPDRTASAPLCQIQMLRTAIDSIVAKRSMGDLNAKSSTSSALFTFRKDLDSSDADILREFYRTAGAFHVLLDLSATLNELGDFSNLWFRELYVELVKSAQIPAEISLPWLLIEHCLDENTSFVEPVLAVLDTYNDAGNCSLYGLQQQHLYDETEAEGKLCFDHFVFLLAERVYLHYKTVAARTTCRQWIDHARLQSNDVAPKSSSATRHNPAVMTLSKLLDTDDVDSKYESILTQRYVSVFGRYYDLTFQLGQRVDALVSKDLENWFTKFEASDATCYVTLLSMLKVLKKTHESLAVLGLDDFDDILGETNDETLGCFLGHPASAIRSRVHEQISQTILTDLCQHFGLKFDDRRFIRRQLHDALTMTVGDQFAHEECLRKAKKHHLSGKSVLRTKIGQPSTGKASYGAFEKTITGSYRAFFGEPHIEAICELLSHRELLDVANDCTDFAVAKNSKAIQLKSTEQSDHGERHPQLLQCVLDRIDSMLKVSEISSEWEAEPDSQPEKMPNASSFYHVWCAFEFLSCNRPRTRPGDSTTDEDSAISLRTMFGDGVQFAGCTLVHLLGQRSLYDLWNVSQHVINVHLCDEVKAASDAQIALVSSKKSRLKNGTPSGQTTVGTLDREMEEKAARFVANARGMRATSERIFHMLEMTWPLGNNTPATFAPPPFTPPVKTPSSVSAHAQYPR